MDELSIKPDFMALYRPSLNLASVSDVLALWPTRRDLEEDLGGEISLSGIHKWGQHNKIQGEWWERLLLAAHSRGIDLTADDLARIHSPLPVDGLLKATKALAS